MSVIFVFFKIFVERSD